MQTSFEMFLLVAKEMSITKAAQKAFVSQQSVSEHIKRLEDRYNLQLFVRKPHFQLTEAGQAMLQSLQQMQLIEHSMNEDLAQRAAEQKGTFTIGINASRAEVILPLVMPTFSKMYPDVSVHFSLQDTAYAEQQLLSGEIDLFLGIDPSFHKEFCYTPLCKDDLRIVVSSALLREVSESFLGLNQHSIIDLKQFEQIPFIFSDRISAVNTLLTNYLNKERIDLWVRYHISDTVSQIQLCRQGLGATFVPVMLLVHIENWNNTTNPDEFLHVFRIKNLSSHLNIQSVRLKNRVYPAYVLDFEQLLQKELQQHFLS